MKNWKKTFASAFAAQVLSIVGLSFMTPFLPFFVAELGVPEIGQQAFYSGLALGATGVSLAVFLPIWGALSDRYGRKVMVCRSMFGGAGVLLLMSLVRTVGQLVACRLLQGVFTGTVSASVALVAGVVPRERRGFALGMMQAAVFIGNSIGPLMGGLVADIFGYRASFRVGAAVIFLGGLLVSLFARENFSRDRGRKREAAPGYLRILATGGFLLAVTIMFGVRFNNLVVNPSFPLIVKEIIPGHPRLGSITGFLFALAGVAGAVSAGVLGHLGDRWGTRRVLATCCFCAAVASAGHFFVGSLDELILVRAMFGLSVAGMLPAANEMICRVTDQRFIGRALGLASSLSMLGMLFGPLIGGTLARSAGLRVPFLVAAGTQVLLGVFVILARFPGKDGGA